MGEYRESALEEGRRVWFSLNSCLADRADNPERTIDRALVMLCRLKQLADPELKAVPTGEEVETWERDVKAILALPVWKRTIGYVGEMIVFVGRAPGEFWCISVLGCELESFVDAFMPGMFFTDVEELCFNCIGSQSVWVAGWRMERATPLLGHQNYAPVYPAGLVDVARWRKPWNVERAHSLREQLQWLQRYAPDVPAMHTPEMALATAFIQSGKWMRASAVEQVCVYKRLQHIIEGAFLLARAHWHEQHKPVACAAWEFVEVEDGMINVEIEDMAHLPFVVVQLLPQLTSDYSRYALVGTCEEPTRAEYAEAYIRLGFLPPVALGLPPPLEGPPTVELRTVLRAIWAANVELQREAQRRLEGIDVVVSAYV